MSYFAYKARVFHRKLTSGEIFNNRLLLENTRLFFDIVFRKSFWGDKALMEGDKVVMGNPQSPPIGKTLKAIDEISQNMYQPKSVDKMADFEALTLCIFLNSSQMCTYFCKDLVTGYCLYFIKIRLPTVISSQIDFISQTSYYGLDVM